MNKTELLDILSGLSPEELRVIAEEAKDLALKKRIAAIPEDVIERLKLSQKRLELGQRITYEFDVPVKLDFKISAEYEYGGFEEIKVEIDSSKLDGSEKKWVDYLKDTWISDASMYIGENCATGVDDKVADACDEESQEYKNFRKLSRNFEEQYGVDIWKVLD
jgi:hypothetical protein